MLHKFDTKNNQYIFTEDKRSTKRIPISRDELTAVLDDILIGIQRINASFYRDPDILEIIREEIPALERYFEVESDGYSYPFAAVEQEIDNFWDRLGKDDDIPSLEDVITLESLGFTQDFSDKCRFEKNIKRNDEVEVTEVVYLFKDKAPSHFLQTIDWEKVSYGLTSKNIWYKELPIDTALAHYIENTRRLML